MVQNDGQPPAEGPRLRQRERQPGAPESHLRRDDRDVDVPHVIRALGRYYTAGSFGLSLDHRWWSRDGPFRG